MSYFRYSSTGPVEAYVIRPKRGVGRSLTYQVVFLEPGLERTLPFGKGNRLRIEGEIEDVPVHLAWMPAPGRGHYLMIAPVVKALGLALGDEVTVRFNPVSEDRVMIPDELEAALASRASWRTLWETQTPGRQRALAAYVTGVKGAAARRQRVETVFAELESGVIVRTGPPARRTAAAGRARVARKKR